MRTSRVDTNSNTQQREGADLFLDSTNGEGRRADHNGASGGMMCFLSFSLIKTVKTKKNGTRTKKTTKKRKVTDQREQDAEDKARKRTHGGLSESVSKRCGGRRKRKKDKACIDHSLGTICYWGERVATTKTS